MSLIWPGFAGGGLHGGRRRSKREREEVGQGIKARQGGRASLGAARRGFSSFFFLLRTERGEGDDELPSVAAPSAPGRPFDRWRWPSVWVSGSPPRIDRA
ncbi:hypothetical protein GUJ93_ZPchr1247g22898 [Zizania palustris]|uniref:Uncharacterized protein n=1 Tax=Zizania palustris TaxID=103762 RepID=A0A8J5RF28_ZIZPA|nr:hypothetical protein GUJ93_ZPchr1247g22898 [Zizania palustris]